MDRVTPELKAKKLSVAEKLDRISNYRISPTEIECIGDPSGRGGYGEVTRASFKRYDEARMVAVKKLLCNDTEDKENFSKEFVHEVQLLAKLSHKNIVQLVGFVEDLVHRKAWIVLSWEPNGNVREFIASGEWEIPERVSLIQDTFEGLEYLHTQKPPICHGDLKSLNIIVSSSYHAIITDFGSSRFMDDKVERKSSQENVRETSQVSTTDESSNHPEVTLIASANQLTLTGPAWSLRWAAPELLIEDEPPGLASDIWSAGWVCWEIMTNKVPFEDVGRYYAITLKVIQGAVPVVHEDAQLAQIIALCTLMKDCWKFKPENRPKVSECCKTVKWMPSTPPLGGTTIALGTKERSPRLLLEMGILHFLHVRHDEAASLLEQVVAEADLAADQEVAEALYWLGGVYRFKCDYPEAEESYKRAQDIYARIGKNHGRANAGVGLGEVYRARSKYIEAEASYAQAQEIYSRIGDDLGRANTLVGIGYVYRAQCKYAEAEESYARGQEIFARLGEDSGQANAVLGLGHIYRARCKHAEAEESYMRAQEIYTRNGNEQGRANTLDGLGGIYRAQCKYTEAEQSYAQAGEICARIGNGLGRANALDGLGDVYRAQCKYTAAEESYTQALEIYAHIDDDHGRANALDGLGDVYRTQCKYAEAEESYSRAEEISARIGNALGQANATLGLGYVYSDQRKDIEAEECYRRAQEIYARIDDNEGLANTSDGLGDVYRIQCEYTAAEESYARAQEIYARVGNDLGLANTELGLGHVYRAQCKDTEAEESYTRAQEIYSRLGNDLGRANALRGLGHLHWEQYRGTEAAQFYTAARDLYSQLGDSDGVEDVSSWLALC